MSELTPYLFFEGTCEEALRFYETCLDGKIEDLSRFGDSPMDVLEDQKNLIIHSQLSFPGGKVFASDIMDGTAQSWQDQNVHLCLSCDSFKQAGNIFKQLSEGGKVTMKFEKQFWGDVFGSLIDKYGIRWMLDVIE